MCSADYVEKLQRVSHILVGCSALTQTRYLARHNAALKILYFEMLRDRGLVQTVPPWYSPAMPKPLYENDNAIALWDVPLHAENTNVRANRIDARIVDNNTKKVIVIEMSCPWLENRQLNDLKKTQKYGPLRWELKRQFQGYEVTQHNIIMDVLGGYSEDVGKTVETLVGGRGEEILRRMQKSVLCNSLNIARSFKVQLFKLQRVQNAAARLICHIPRFEHITPILHHLHWLPVKYRINFKVLLIVFKALHDLATDYIIELISIRPP